VFLYLESLSLFGSTSIRGVLGGLPMPRHTLKSLIPDRVPPKRRDLGLLQRRRHRGPSGRTQRRSRSCGQVVDRLALCRVPSAPPSAAPQRAPTGGSFQCFGVQIGANGEPHHMCSLVWLAVHRIAFPLPIHR
jgi:hypothetical protein